MQDVASIDPETAGPFILSGEGEGGLRGEEAGPTSHPEAGVGSGRFWGPSGIREALGCGFGCCRGQTKKTGRRKRSV